MTKWCPRCRRLRQREEFGRNRTTGDGLQSYCRECSRELSRQYHAKYGEQRKAERHRHYERKGRPQRLEREFGITAEEYERRLTDQLGVCAVCRKPPSGARRLAVDHDHATGEVRGLLCAACNTAIGLLGDSPLLVTAAAAYLIHGADFRHAVVTIS